MPLTHAGEVGFTVTILVKKKKKKTKWPVVKETAELQNDSA